MVTNEKSYLSVTPCVALAVVLMPVATSEPAWMSVTVSPVLSGEETPLMPTLTVEAVPLPLVRSAVPVTVSMVPPAAKVVGK